MRKPFHTCSWTYGTNSHPDWRRGTLYLMDQPWYWALAEWLIECPLAWFCDRSPLARIPLPNWFPKARWPELDPERLYTLREWYGNLGGVLWGLVFSPAFQWYWRHAQQYEIAVDLGYDRVREIFEPRYPDSFRDDDERWAGEMRGPQEELR